METERAARWSPRDRHEVRRRSWKDELDWCAIFGRWLHDLAQRHTGGAARRAGAPDGARGGIAGRARAPLRGPDGGLETPAHPPTRLRGAA
jgi:hypothetical protein